MSERRRLKLDSLDGLIAELEHLKQGCRSIGNWSLAQTAWHLSRALNAVQPVPARAVSTPEQAAAKKERLDFLLGGGEMGPGIPVPTGMDPLKDYPPAAEATAVDDFIGGLKSFQQNSQPQIAFGRFGLVTRADFERFILIHSSHHLNNLIPTT